jgi:hypothetical protein
MPGHVFLLHGDLTRLACDAWLMPTDARLRVLSTWRRWPPNAPPPLPDEAPSRSWVSGKTRVMKLRGWPEANPRPWLVNVGAGEKERVEWFVAGAEEFLDRAAEDLAKRRPRHGRARHLVGLPLVGTGQGGKAAAAGLVVQKLLPLLARAARRHDFDVALVVLDDAAFAAAQAERARVGASQWRELGEDLRRRAESLAEKATRGELVLFLGAGVSAAAGLPLWQALLDLLAGDAELTAEEQRDLRRLSATDQAWFIERRIAEKRGAAGARRAIADRVRGFHPSLLHFALAALPVREIVTTNYDQLFEIASEGMGQRVSVIPHDLDRQASRWLLKMHGSVTHPEDIVLTREDFMRYEQRRQALAGIVQALLITRHMLFVGFSLEDENFHRIADSVRRALGHADARYGTVLSLAYDPLLEGLWERDLVLLPMGEPVRDEKTRATRIAERARKLEIFFDYILSRTARAPSHVLDERFAAVLTRGERTLRDRVRAFAARVPEEARKGGAWEEVRAMIARLGGD